jgi:hypothetical protein
MRAACRRDDPLTPLLLPWTYQAMVRSRVLQRCALRCTAAHRVATCNAAHHVCSAARPRSQQVHELIGVEYNRVKLEGRPGVRRP